MLQLKTKDMGYTTDFSGCLKLSRPATKDEKDYINSFSGTRRMRRDVNKLMELYGGKYGYPFPHLLSGKVMGNTPETIYGREGEYFAKDDGNFGQEHDASVVDYNCPPGQLGFDSNSDFNSRWNENQRKITEGLCQPGLWCQWVITDDGEFLEWDGGEKFYNYVEWLKYLIEHFFSKWDITLDGEIEWWGEDSDDRGKIVVKNNEVNIYDGVTTFRKR